MDNYIINTEEFQITQFEFLTRFLIAVGIGFLIGFEREHAALAKKEEDFAGIRTFIFLSILGFIGTALHYLIAPWILASIVFAVVLLTTVSYWITASKGNIGGTSELTGILAVFLGALTFIGHLEISLLITVLMIVLLSAKMKMQEVISSITKEELYDFIRFVVLALMIFPFLPDETYGPYDVFNPKEIGWVIILTSGIGLVGHILMRFFGADKGILMTGIIGGLVSSTAVTWVFSKKSKEQPTLSLYCATAILAASSIMVVRVGIWVVIFNPELLTGLAIALGLVFLTAIGVTIFYYLKSRNNKQVSTEMPTGRPLNLTGALIFGALYTVILFVVAYSNAQFGAEGIYVASGIAGVSDVDAITITVSKLSMGSIAPQTAQIAILIATISNTLVKSGIAIWAGSTEIRKYILIGYGTMVIAAVIGFIVMTIMSGGNAESQF